MGSSAANSPPKSRSKTPHANPPRPGGFCSLRCMSSFSAAWRKGVLSIPGKGRAWRRSWPCRYFAFQGVKELNF